MTFSYQVLSLPTKANNRKDSLSSIIRKNLANLDDPEYDVNISIPAKSKPNTSLKFAVERKMLDGNVSGAVRILTSDDSVGSPTEELFNMLRSKHPAANKDPIYPPDPEPNQGSAYPVTATEVLSAITSFPNGSAGGLDAIRPQHLKDLTGGVMGPTGQKLCDRLALVVDIMLSGNVPANITPVLYGACLTALKKKDGGVRPIAVGNTLRRLAAKIVCSRSCESMGELLRPNQLGYGTKGGTEAAIHATRSYLTTKSEDAQVLLKLDFTNAFNSIHRDKLLHCARSFLPQYYSFIWQLYRNPTLLAFGDYSLNSNRGIQQGDPLGPLLFCLVTKDLTSLVKSPLNSWYLDDGIIAGNFESVHKDLDMVQSKGDDIGLNLNMCKCEAYIFGGSDLTRKRALSAVKCFAPNIKFPTSSELSLLGSPLLPEGTSDAIESKIRAMKLLSSRLPLLHAHHALFIMKHCLGAPKVLHLLRCAHTWQERDKLMELDEIIRLSLISITNTELDAKAWKQAGLPVNKGGIGIRHTEELALPAYLASVHSVAGLIADLFPEFSLEDTTSIPIQEWQKCTGLPPPSSKKLQKHWDIPLIDLAYQQLLTSSTIREKARLQAVSLKESGSWLNALPISCLGNFLDDDSLRVSVALRLGAVVCCPFKCKCGIETDIFGHHGLSCNKSSGRYSRHAAINDIVRRALSSANVPAILEPPGLIRDDGRRPDGMTLMPWSCGKALVWDVTCVDSLADSNIVSSIKAAGAAAAKAEEKKVVKYKSLEGKFTFRPLGFETFGAWGPSSKELISAIGRRISERTGEIRSTTYLRQRISIEIQRGNAASIFNTIPSNKGLDEIFNILDDKNLLHPSIPVARNSNAVSVHCLSDQAFSECISNNFAHPALAEISSISTDPLSAHISNLIEDQSHKERPPSNSISNSSPLSRRYSDKNEIHRYREYSDDDSSGERSSNSYSCTIRTLAHDPIKTPGLNGLRNIGNTCFMSSVIQCLSNTRWLLEYLRNDQYLRELNSNISRMKGALFKAFAEVIKELWSEDSANRVVSYVSLKSQIQTFAPRFIGYAQQDAQEFLLYLLEGLHEDVNGVTEKPRPLLTGINEKLSDNENAQESWSRYLRMENSKMVDNFVGQLKSTLKCTYCGHCSVIFDPFWDLSLPLPQGTGHFDLSQCLDLFTREETLEGDEKLTCSKCLKRRKCTKSFSIHKFPKILVFHLKRFSSTERFRGKLNVTIDFPLEGLDMSNYAAENVSTSKYNLYAISNHSGTTNRGHYTAYCRHPYTDTWHEYNDSSVSTISPKSVISSEAYILFYEQEGGKCHLQMPPIN